MAKFVRAREGTGVLRHPETGDLSAPNPANPVESTDPLVKAYPWAFVSDEDLAAEQAAAATSWQEGAIELARRADAEMSEREKVAKEDDADAVKMAEARAKGKPQGDDAERDIRTGETVDDDEVETASADPGTKRSNTRKK